MNTGFLKPGLAALTAAASLAALSGFAQDNADLDRKLRELNIMNNIFEAAMEERGDNGRYSIRRVGRSDALYLSGQGMVFSFRVLNNQPVRFQGGNFDAQWLSQMQEAFARTRESLERVRASFPDADFDFDFDFDYEDNNNQVFITRGQFTPQQAFFIGGGGQEQEAAREMEAAMRDTQENIRDIQRDIRELERDMREEDANEQTLQARIDDMEADMDTEMVRLDEQRQAYETYINDLRAARQEQQLAIVNEASDQLIATLCDYGATLRSLANNEHVTLILEDVVDDRDQVYVFSYSDISDCSDTETLKQNAVSYQLPGY